MLFPATPGWGPLAAGLCGRLPLLAGGLVAVPRHSWMGGPLVAVLGGPLALLAVGLGGGSRPLLAGVRRPRRWVFPRVGVSRFVCACGVACACGACAGVCGVVCVRGVCVGGGVGVGGPSACVCVCGCVYVCDVLLVCGVVRCGVLVGVWLVCGVVGPSPLLAEVPVCYSPPLLAGFRCRWWWAFLATPGSGSWGRLPATAGWGPPAAVVGFSAGRGFLCCVCLWHGARWCVRCVLVAVVWVWVCLLCVLACVWRRVAFCFPGWGLLLVLVWVGVWLVCGRSLATPGRGSCVRFPATSGWVALPVVVRVPRHFWLRAPGAVPCRSWLGSAGGGGVWLLAPFGCGPGYSSPPLLAGVRRPRRWPFAWGWVGVSRGVCVCGAVRARVVSVLVCVSCVRGGVGVGVSSVCVGVCVCVCVGVWLGPAGACRWCGCGCG